MKNAYNKSETSDSHEVDLQHNFKGRTLRSRIYLKVETVKASVPCPSCNISTREMMKSINVPISDDDAEVDMVKIFSTLKLNTGTLLDPNYVFIITRAVTTGITDVNSGSAILADSTLSRMIYTHNAMTLVGSIICDNCCFTTEHLDSLLNKD